MATVEKFEELIAWQKARQYAHEIFELTCLEKFNSDFSLVGQIRKSSGSVMDNIAEGFDRGGNKEFIQFLYIAKGSLSETKSQLYRAFYRKYINNIILNEKLIKAEELAKIIGALISYLQNSKFKGRKFNIKPEN
jgi:four helix bundle protein